MRKGLEDKTRGPGQHARGPLGRGQKSPLLWDSVTAPPTQVRPVSAVSDTFPQLNFVTAHFRHQ